MKMINYTTGYHGRKLIFRDDTQADAAYATLKKAVSEYKEYGNDTNKSVTVSHGNGEVTIRLGSNGISDVSISPMDDDEIATMAEYSAFSRRAEKAAEIDSPVEIGAVAEPEGRSA